MESVDPKYFHCFQSVIALSKVLHIHSILLATATLRKFQTQFIIELEIKIKVLVMGFK